MDHPCYKCGHTVEDGKPFCSQCGAPQIRVAMPEALPAMPNSSAFDPLPVFSDAPAGPGILSPSTLSTGIEWRRALRACAIAALISIAVTSVRIMPPLLSGFGAGVLAVLLYYRRASTLAANARDGAQIGALTGCLSSAVFAIFFSIFLAVLQAGGEIRQQMIEALQQAASRSNDPQIQATIEFLVKPENVSKLLVGMVSFVVLSIAAGSLAGALTGAFLGRRKRP
jgi:hypothetical protein